MGRRPYAIRIAKRRAQQLNDLGKDLRPLRLLELLEEGAAEGLQPPLHADFERGWTRHQHDCLDREAALPEQTAVFGDRREEPGSDLLRIASACRR
jgi:hypothetical protein